MQQLEDLIETSKALHSGDIVYDQGEKFNKIYAIKSGSLKSVFLDEAGNERITGFHLPGELVGLDGIYSEQYASTAIALETVVMCEFDFSALSDLCLEIKSLQKQVFRLLSRDIHESQNEQSKHIDLTAEQKLANFLNNLSARYQARNFSAIQFPLTMPRQDIANHLGMAPETISRLLKRFKEKGIVEIEKNTIHLVNESALDDVVYC
ncbi:UNVERIFIED_CONTAM: hypothetical protein GTU68_003741 [Idotea baltica]|nr:hypothetical protein [Idotea baltica]